MNPSVNKIDPAIGDEKADGGHPRRSIRHKNGKSHQDQHREEVRANDSENIHYEGLRFRTRGLNGFCCFVVLPF